MKKNFIHFRSGIVAVLAGVVSVFSTDAMAVSDNSAFIQSELPVYKPIMKTQDVDPDGLYVGMEVTTARPGSIASNLADELKAVDSLVVKGPINGDDIHALWRASLYGHLSVLDLGQTQIEGNVIADYAFYNPDEQVVSDGVRILNLRKIVLPEGITAIGNYAFCYNMRLEELNIPATVAELGKRSFSYCSSLQTSPLIVPEGITDIPEMCFMECRLLDEVVLPSSLEHIGDFAFFSSKVKKINFPEGLKSIGNSAFYGARMKEVILPESCLEFEGDSHFALCYELLKIHIPEALETIPESFLASDIVLTEMNVPANAKTIGVGAFQELISITRLILPPSLSLINNHSFKSMSSLSEIYCMAATPPTCAVGANIEDFWGIPNTVTLYIPEGSLDAYKNNPAWAYFTNIVETNDFPSAGVEDASADAPINASATFDLMGRGIDSPQEGQIYIQKGRKFIQSGN